VLSVESVRDVPGRERVVYAWTVEDVVDERFTRRKLTVTHPGAGEMGVFSDKVAVTTTHPQRKTIDLNVRLQVVPRILSRSRVIPLGYIQPGVPKPPMRTRIQAGAPGIRFAVTGVRVESPEGAGPRPGGPGFTAVAGQDDRGWYVEVAYDGKSRAAGLLEAVLVVETDDEQQPEIRVPIRATIQAH
jgi:hypothetical protein